MRSDEALLLDMLLAARRNRVVHEYFRINLIALWEVSIRDVPHLIRQLESLIPPDDDEDTLP